MSIDSKSSRTAAASLMLLAASILAAPVQAQQPAGPSNSVPPGVVALGRLAPENGILRIAAPALMGITLGPAILELHVAEGEDVLAGQLLAVTDLAPLMQTMVAEREAALALIRQQVNAAQAQAESACALVETRREEANRRAQWRESNVATREEYEQALAAAVSVEAGCVAARAEAEAAGAGIALAEAALARAEAERMRTEIRAPRDGRILQILSWPGELVGPAGALMLGSVERMYAIAEVYETDIARVQVGQAAIVTSAALPTPLSGRVHHVRQKVQKQDEIGTDPAARKDARIVEVEILLDDAGPARGLSNLQVTVQIGS